MFIFLSKFLPVLVYPIGLACILLIISLFMRERRRAETILVLTALVVLWVGGQPLGLDEPDAFARMAVFAPCRRA